MDTTRILAMIAIACASVSWFGLIHAWWALARAHRKIAILERLLASRAVSSIRYLGEENEAKHGQYNRTRPGEQ